MPPRAKLTEGSKRKLIEFDAETWHGLHMLSVDSMKDLQELANEAFADSLSLLIGNQDNDRLEHRGCFVRQLQL
jgi:hypothetical protein